MIDINNREKVSEKLNLLQTDSLPFFGKMTAQHMVEHLTFAIMFSNGKLPQKLYFPIDKAEIIKKTIEGEISPRVPATYLQQHNNTTFVLDTEASSELTRVKTPWLVKSCVWTDELKLKAVAWLSELTKKPFLKLTDKDYNDNGMSSLLTEEGTAYDLNIKMFNKMQQTITGWPGGKPNADDTIDRNVPHRRERESLFSARTQMMM